MAEEEETLETVIKPSIPPSRIKRIVKIDKDINRITSEALFIISGATDLFLQSLAEKSAKVAGEKKRKTVNVEHLRIAVKRHQPTRDFLLDSLPQPSDHHHHPTAADRTVKEKEKKSAAMPRNTRRIDSFFSKPQNTGALDCVDDDDDEGNVNVNDVDES